MEPLRIAVVGVESTGKTSLTQALAAHYACLAVKEIARDYIDNLNRKYTEDDLLEIAHLQKDAELRCASEARRRGDSLVICDTTLLTIYIWGIVWFERSDAWIVQHMQQHAYAHHLLTDVHVPWTADPQRGFSKLSGRKALHALYLEKLKQYNWTYTQLRGDKNAYLQQATSKIDALLRST